MAPKRTKPEGSEAKAAKPAPKRKMVVGPPITEARAATPTATPIIKAITPPAPKMNVKSTRKPVAVIPPAPVNRVEEPVASVASVASTRTAISTDDIALRAYFLGQRRQENGLAGDSTTDWLEAEQQLRSEVEA